VLKKIKNKYVNAYSKENLKENSIHFLIYIFQFLEYKRSSLFIGEEMRTLKDTRNLIVMKNQEIKTKSHEV
jgi:hypothetical protein